MQRLTAAHAAAAARVDVDGAWLARYTVISLPPDALATISSRTAIERSEPPLLFTVASSTVSSAGVQVAAAARLHAVPSARCRSRVNPSRRTLCTSNVVDGHVDGEIAAAGRHDLERVARKRAFGSRRPTRPRPSATTSFGSVTSAVAAIAPIEEPRCAGVESRSLPPRTSVMISSTSSSDDTSTTESGALRGQQDRCRR